MEKVMRMIQPVKSDLQVIVPDLKEDITWKEFSIYNSRNSHRIAKYRHQRPIYTPKLISLLVDEFEECIRLGAPYGEPNDYLE